MMMFTLSSAISLSSSRMRSAVTTRSPDSTHDPGLREQRCGFLLEALDARPAGDKAVARLAFRRTRGRALCEEAAVMAQ
jgi:hypothetical protein